MSASIHVLEHPLIQQKLTLLRDANTNACNFRALTGEIGSLLAYELMRDTPTRPLSVDTPLGRARGVELDTKAIVLVAVLRAGLGVVDGMLRTLPAARVGHIGLYREPRLLTAVEYYLKLPEDLEGGDAIIVCSVLATGVTASAAAHRVREGGARSVRFACLVACPQGIATFHQQHPDIPVFTCAIDEELNDKGFIVPGLGDVGDRLYGTK